MSPGSSIRFKVYSPSERSDWKESGPPVGIANSPTAVLCRRSAPKGCRLRGRPGYGQIARGQVCLMAIAAVLGSRRAQGGRCLARYRERLAEVV